VVNYKRALGVWVCHSLRVERARQRLCPPLQLPHQARPGLSPHRRIRPQRVCHSLRLERARHCMSIPLSGWRRTTRSAQQSLSTLESHKVVPCLHCFS
jgi:hypothetical protein